MYDKLEKIWMKDKQENKELNEQRRRHTKIVLKKSARVDWRKQKTATGIFIFFKANCAMFTDLTVPIESELESEKLTTETSMS